MPKARIHRKTERSPADLAALRAKREKFQRDRPTLAQLVASGEYTEPVTQQEYWNCRKVGLLLKQLRERQGLSLGDLSSRTGMDRAALSRLENSGNPTLKTLFRYAEGIDMAIVFEGSAEKSVIVQFVSKRSKGAGSKAS